MTPDPIDDQAAVAEFLASPETHGGAAVERIDTHSAMVFVAGERAWKLKRAVRFDYLDFSTVDRRRASCETEVRLNRRTAPALYRGTVAVTRQPDGSLALGGTGEPVDWVVEMARFDQDALFDRLAASGRLELALMEPLAEAIAGLHLTAQRRTDHGGRAGMAWVVEGNATGFARFGAGTLDADRCARITAAARAELERHGGLLDARRDGGLVRQCHGDLHLGNIVLIDGQPTLFDAVDFNDEIACNDVLYDLAFLLMDLWHRQLPGHANAVWNRYLAQTDDLGGLPLMPLFLSCRAAVRAKTSATAASVQEAPEQRRRLETVAGEYLELAESFLHPPAARLIAVGGLSGSGKSVLARTLASGLGAAPGAVVLRSDDTRKRLCGLERLERLGPDGYAPGITARVYAMLREQAALIVGAGHSAFVDAVHATPEERQAIERVAAAAGVPFSGIWLDAPEAVLTDRVARRRHDPSDATADVVRDQLARDTGIIAWHRIDASLPPEQVRHRATAEIGS